MGAGNEPSVQKLLQSCLGWHPALQLPALKFLAATLTDADGGSRHAQPTSLTSL